MDTHRPLDNDLAAHLALPTNLDELIDLYTSQGRSLARLCRYRGRDAVYGTDSDASVDWATLFPYKTTCTDCSSDTTSTEQDVEDEYWGEDFCDECAHEQAQLTPRQAAMMSIQVDCLIDMVLDEATAQGGLDFTVCDQLSDDVLPIIAGPFLTDHRWVVRLLHTFHLIGARLRAGLVPYPRNTGEEVALHFLIRCARELHSDGFLICGVEDLPEYEADLAYEIGDWVFEDLDVLFLYDPAFDGIEGSDLVQALGMVNLHPRDWFTDFRAPDTTVEVDLSPFS